MHGGPSQVDTFDYKPLLDARPRQAAAVRQAARRLSADRQPAGQSPWKFRQYGQSGAWVSELFPHVAGVRRRPLLHPLACTARTRGTAARCWNCTPAATRSCGPAWARGSRYGLGTENAEPARLHHDLPDADPRRRQQLQLGLPAGRLSGHAAGQRQRAVGAGQDSVHRQPRTRRATLQRLELDLLREMNREHLAAHGARPGAGRPHRVVRTGLPHAGRRARAAGHLRRNRQRRSKLYGLDDPRDRRTSAASA